MKNRKNTEYEILDFIEQIAKKTIGVDSVSYVLDLGSRDGESALELADCFPNAKIISIEANPDLIESIKAKTRHNNRISIYNFAVSDKEGEHDFYRATHGNLGASSLFEKSGEYDQHENYQFSEPIKVQTKRLDLFLEELDIPKIDVIWADIQGYELYALQGLGKYIKDVSFISAEVSYKEMYKNQPLFHEFDYFMLVNELRCVFRDYKHGNFWGESLYISDKNLLNK